MTKKTFLLLPVVLLFTACSNKDVQVNSNEVRPNEEVKKFSHLFVFKSQKVGASWKVANMLEAEAKLMNK